MFVNDTLRDVVYVGGTASADGVVKWGPSRSPDESVSAPDINRKRLPDILPHSMIASSDDVSKRGRGRPKKVIRNKGKKAVHSADIGDVEETSESVSDDNLETIIGDDDICQLRRYLSGGGSDLSEEDNSVEGQASAHSSCGSLTTCSSLGKMFRDMNTQDTECGYAAAFDDFQQTVSPYRSIFEHSQPLLSPLTQCSSFDGSDFGFGSQQNSVETKRRKASEHSRRILLEWIAQHQDHPYPTSQEKRDIASRAGMTVAQVVHWMSNMRKRRLLPMLKATATGYDWRRRGGAAGGGVESLLDPLDLQGDFESEAAAAVEAALGDEHSASAESPAKRRRA